MLATLLVLCFTVAGRQAANILAVPATRLYSHFTVMEPLFKELAARGHQVTVVSSFPQKTPLPNYHDIDIGEVMPPVYSLASIDWANQLGKNPFSNMAQVWDIANNMCEKIMDYGPIQDLYNSGAHFDLVINQVFSYECLTVFAGRFNTPIVSLVTASALPWSNPRVGNPDHPAYIVNNYIDAHEKMTLYQRTLNTLAWLWASVAIHPLLYDRTNDLIHRVLDPSAPAVQETMRRTSLVLVNSHFSMLQSRPFVPNFVEIGGIHIKDPKPLPIDLMEYLDQATHGAIVFSLGSLVRASTMDNSTLRALMGAFASLPQRVVFKFEESVEDAPPNVMVRKWLPQRDILEHPNVRVLMAHGGLSSTIEAVHTATPMVGIPLFSDQYNNIQTLVLKGAAELLTFPLTKDKVLHSLNKVLNESSYKANAQRLSHLFRDRPLPPLQTAVYWTEYVLRHKGAPQLRSKAADLPWYQFLLLDVIAVLLLLIVLTFYIVKCIINNGLYLFSKAFRSIKS